MKSKNAENVSKPSCAEPLKKDEGAVPKQPEAASYREWRDAKAKEKEKESLLLEEKKKDYEKRLKEFEAKEKRFVKKAERLEKNREKLLSKEKDKHEDNDEVPDTEKGILNFHYNSFLAFLQLASQC